MELEDKTKKDYTQKILNRFEGDMENVELEAKAINELVCFFNISFTERNNFYLEDFNKKKLREVGLLYNQIKSNILSEWTFADMICMLNEIDDIKIKLLRFIVKSFVNNYDELVKSNTNININKEYMVVCLAIINRK